MWVPSVGSVGGAALRVHVAPVLVAVAAFASAEDELPYALIGIAPPTPQV